MSYLKFHLAGITLLFSFSAFCQNPTAVTMRWKVKPGETLTYKTYMKLDTSASDKSPFGGFFDSMDSLGKDKADSKADKLSNRSKANRRKNMANAQLGFSDMMQKMRSLVPEYYITSMKGGQHGLINLEMLPFRTATTDTAKKQDGFLQMFDSMSSEPLLNATIHEDGALESFYLGNEENNILALFFQLPAKPVNINDTISIATHFVNVGARFKCDTAYKKNKVWIADIEHGPAGEIVTVKYDIEEYVAGSYRFPFQGKEVEQAGGRLQTTFKTVFTAIAKFSVAEGRWLTYEGDLEVSNSGFIGLGHSKKWYRLVPQ